MLARQIRRPRPGLVLLQHPDDLIFREPCSLHLSVLQEGRTLNPRGGKSQWQVSSKQQAIQRVHMPERIAKLIIGGHATADGWRVPEHFMKKWLADRTYAGGDLPLKF